MDEKMLLEAISKMLDEKLDAKLDEKLKPINDRLEKIEEDIAELKEDHAITRDGVNTLLGWADDVACVVKIPLRPAN